MVCADAQRRASASPAFSTRDTVDTLTPTSSAIIRSVTGAKAALGCCAVAVIAPPRASAGPL